MPYKTRFKDEHGEIIAVPEIRDPVVNDAWGAACNFCIYHESRQTGAHIKETHPERCGSTGCNSYGDPKIYIYRHELREYKARAFAAKVNSAAHKAALDEKARASCS